MRETLHVLPKCFSFCALDQASPVYELRRAPYAMASRWGVGLCRLRAGLWSAARTYDEVHFALAILKAWRKGKQKLFATATVLGGKKI